MTLGALLDLGVSPDWLQDQLHRMPLTDFKISVGPVQRHGIHAVQPLVDQILQNYPQVVSVINNVTSRKAGVAVGEFEQVLAGTEIIADRIGDFEFEISSNSLRSDYLI